MSKNVAVFVDVANIFYAAKAAGVDIDYVTLLKSATAGRDFVRAYAYTGLDPDNENQRNFHNFLARNGYKVVSKDIRKYGDGKVKANLDIELVVDLMKTARNLDVAVVVSGDGDFAPAIRAVQEMGVRVEVVSFRGNTSSDLMDVADLFTDITQIARVEKGSSRSGRRVAGDEEDLSMTEVPDKQTEGSGRGRGTRSRTGRGRDAESARREVAPAASATGRRRTAASPPATPAVGGLVALPGEKLSKVGGSAPEETPAVEEEAAAVGGAPEGEETEEGRRRRRRRRGGRGRGRGRGAEGAGLPADTLDDVETIPESVAIAPPSRAPRPGAFGSVWDSQIGVPTAAARSEPPIDDEDLDEPEIPEYLIAEQRRGGRAGSGGRGPSMGRGGAGGRGGRSAYVAAVERERYGTGRGGGGFNRYPDVSGRTTGRADQGRRPERQDRPERPPRRPSSEPWSEVPPELEEVLRAQLESRAVQGAPAGGRTANTRSAEVPVAMASIDEAEAVPATRRRSTRKPAVATDGAASPAAPDAEATAKPAARRRTTSKATAATTGDGETAKAPTRRRTTRKPEPTDVEAAPTADAPTATGTKPRRRTTPKAPPAD